MENAACRITINGQHTGISLRTVPAPRNQSGAIQRAVPPPHMLPAQGATFNGPSQVSSASRRKPQRYGRYPLTHSGASRLKAFFQKKTNMILCDIFYTITQDLLEKCIIYIE